jgi:hypothetical protein
MSILHVLFLYLVKTVLSQTTGGDGYPSFGYFLYSDRVNTPTLLTSTSISGSTPNTYADLPGSGFIWGLAYNKLYDADNAVYFNSVNRFWYSWNIPSGVSTLISGSAQNVAFTASTRTARHPNGTVYGLEWKVTTGGSYRLFAVPDLVTPAAATIWAVGGSLIRSMAITPDGMLYGGHTDGTVRALDWDTGAMGATITGFPTIPAGFTAVPSQWITFDLSGSTLYFPVTNTTVTYIAACYLPSSSINLTLESPSIFYTAAWNAVQMPTFYGTTNAFFF